MYIFFVHFTEPHKNLSFSIIKTMMKTKMCTALHIMTLFYHFIIIFVPSPSTSSPSRKRKSIACDLIKERETYIHNFLNIFFFRFLKSERMKTLHGEELETYKHQLPEKKNRNWTENTFSNGFFLFSFL